MLRTVYATRYVAPFREGGSVPALVEADDDGLYVVKLRGAGQGVKTLVAELVGGELARAAGLAVPEIVLVEVDEALGKAEPDPEIAAPLEASAGLNVGLDFLPGSITFDAAARRPVDAQVAARVVLVDAFIANVDRTPRNPNLLDWHGQLWLIDHGASLYFHHGWSPSDPTMWSDDPFGEVRHHVLLDRAEALADAAAHLAEVFTDEVFRRTIEAIPSCWLDERDGFADEGAHRAAYVAWLSARRSALPILLEEAERAHSRAI